MNELETNKEGCSVWFTILLAIIITGTSLAVYNGCTEKSKVEQFKNDKE